MALPSGRASRSCTPAGLLADASANLVNDPLSAASLSDLGQALIDTDDTATAARAMELAGQMGWRDRPTQLYWLTTAISAGEPTVAAQRLDALLRTGSEGPAANSLVAQVEAMPGGRAALVERLGYTPAWRDRVLLDVDELDSARTANRVALITAARGAGLAPGCPAAQPVMQKLVDAGAADEARALSGALCPSSAGIDGLARVSFADRDEAPLAWKLSGSGGSDVSIADAPAPIGEPALRAEIGGTRSVLLAQRPVVLKAGRYRISWTSIGGDGTAQLYPVIRCVQAKKNLDPDGGDPTRSGHLITIPAAGCATQRVVIRGTSSAGGSGGPLWLGRLAVTPAA